MSASHHVSEQQLAMFMPAGELGRKSRYGGGRLEGETRKQAWGRKLEESKVPSDQWQDWDPAENEPVNPPLYPQIAAEGVKTPVVLNATDDTQHDTGGNLIWHDKAGTVRDGHHRIAAAKDIDPSMEIPVRWA
jgi:hypothetical protein